jgi:glyoxylase-like metal-dependent hydrolase (beta-lactamase superfamily II)
MLVAAHNLPVLDRASAGVKTVPSCLSVFRIIGGVEDLGGVPVMVSAAGKRFIDTKRQDTAVLNSFRGVNYKQYDFEGGPYLGFPHSHDVWGDGSVVIVPAPGHTPDSVVVFVTLPSGARYAPIGDLVFQMEGIELPAEKP